ncbi:MAG: hypothetical protein ABUL44_01950, partial [Flavobacterium sp.]
MRKALLFILLLCLEWSARAQSIDLVKSFGSTNNISVTAMRTASNGDILLAGEFADTVDFDPGPGLSTAIASGNYYTYLARFDAAGNFLWVKTWDFDITLSYKGRLTMGILPGDEIFMSGFFLNTADFDPGAGNFQLSFSNGTCFFLKLSSAGDFIWAKSI